MTDPMIIDYVTNGKTDLPDIYLSAKCRFFLSTGTGIDAVGTIFRRPVARVNFSVFGYFHTWGPNDLFISKKLWLREERRFLNIREVLKSGAGEFIRSEEFDQFGIDLIENGSEEITDLALEMEDRLSGMCNMTQENVELQRRFRSFF